MSEQSSVTPPKETAPATAPKLSEAVNEFDDARLLRCLAQVFRDEGDGRDAWEVRACERLNKIASQLETPSPQLLESAIDELESAYLFMQLPAESDAEQDAANVRYNKARSALIQLFASPREEATSWQDAESAPKTGEHILVSVQGRGGFGICGGKWQDWCAVVHYWPHEGEEGFYLSSGLSGDETPVTFTHWLPLGRSLEEMAQELHDKLPELKRTLAEIESSKKVTRKLLDTRVDAAATLRRDSPQKQEAPKLTREDAEVSAAITIAEAERANGWEGDLSANDCEMLCRAVLTLRSLLAASDCPQEDAPRKEGDGK